MNWRFFRRCLFGFLLVTISAHGALAGRSEMEISGIENVQDDDLRRVIVEYYAAEKTGDWKKTYVLRNLGMHRVFVRENYIRTMEQDTFGWNLEAVIVEGYRTGEVPHAKAFTAVRMVDILFIERVEVEYSLLGQIVRDKSSAGEQLKSRETTVWVKEAGRWKCFSCGFRGHLNSNLPFLGE